MACYPRPGAQLSVSCKECSRYADGLARQVTSFLSDLKNGKAAVGSGRTLFYFSPFFPSPRLSGPPTEVIRNRLGHQPRRANLESRPLLRPLLLGPLPRPIRRDSQHRRPLLLRSINLLRSLGRRKDKRSGLPDCRDSATRPRSCYAGACSAGSAASSACGAQGAGGSV